MSTGLVVIGIGNRDRGDDAVGPHVADLLGARVGARAAILVEDGEPGRLLERLGAAAAAILVDACRSGAAPGTIRRLDAAAEELPAGRYAWSSHGVGLAEAVELARALGRLPRSCIVYAVEGRSFEPGAALSPEVAAAADRVVAAVLAELAGAGGESEGGHA